MQTHRARRVTYKIDVVGLQLPQTRIHRRDQALGAISDVVDHDLLVAIRGPVVSRVFGGND